MTESSQTPRAACTALEVQQVLNKEFPGDPVRVDTVEYADVTIRQPAGSAEIRPGNTISGPTLMALADCAAWVAVFSVAGIELMAVTSHLDIDFLRRPPADDDLLARARVVKHGRRLCIMEVHIRRSSDDAIVARAAVTYAMP